MKGRIEQLAKGDFLAIKPLVSFSVDRIEAKLAKGDKLEGTFEVTSLNSEVVKGRVFSSDYFLELSPHEFIGEKTRISYSIDSKNFRAQDVIQGKICVTTNGGECFIPFSVEILGKKERTSVGEINDIFQFASLAQSNWKQALELFYQDSFVHLFLREQKELKRAYEQVTKSYQRDQALEEFLIAASKKNPVMLSVDKNALRYSEEEKITSGFIEIRQKNWGYMHAKVRSDVPFISVNESYFDTFSLHDRKYHLKYSLHPEYLKNGTNFGHIYVENTNQKIEIPVIFTKAEKKENKTVNHTIKENYVALYHYYFDLRMGKIELKEYIEKSKASLEILMKEDRNNGLFKLLKINMDILSQEKIRVENELKRIQKDEYKTLENNEQRAYFAYLKALFYRDKDSIKQAVSLLRTYDNEEKNPIYISLLLFLDEGLQEDEARMKVLLRAYERGMNSPFIFFEASEILKNNPSMLNQLDDFYQNVVLWDFRKGYLSPLVLDQFIFLAGREKEYKEKVFHILSFVYETEKKEEILFAICSLLLKGNKIKHCFHLYYLEAIKKNMKLVGLKEAFVRSMDFEEYELFPPEVLMYYENMDGLNEYERGYLYADFIFYQKQYGSYYDMFDSQIEEFMMQQIRKGAMNDHLAVLYAKYLKPKLVTNEVAKELANIIFKRKLICENDSIVAVVVKQDELNFEQKVPLIHHVAYVDILSEQAIISLVDKDGNYHVNSVEYKLEKLVEEKAFIQRAYKNNPYDYRVLLYYVKLLQQYHKQDIQSINAACDLLAIEEITEQTRQEVLCTVLHYYYENYSGEIFDDYLKKVDLSYLNDTARQEIINYYFIRNLFDLAYAAVKEYGYAEIDKKSLFKMSSYLVQNKKYLGEELLTAICARLAWKGKYDKYTIAYLMENFGGSTKRMIRLWEMACEFSLNTRELEENIIVQMLFSGGYGKKKYDVFLEYLNKKPRQAVVKAFLRNEAYEYFVNHMMVPQVLFELLLDALKQELLQDEITKIAILQYYSGKEEMLEKKEELVPLLNDFIKQDKIMPFFKNYKKIMRLPKDLEIKTYLSYEAIPGTEVSIYYNMGDGKETQYHKEAMEEIFIGHYQKAFIVFQNEKLMYYITEKREGVEETTQSDGVLLDASLAHEEESRFTALNLMMVSKELKDEKTLEELMLQYMKLNHILDSNLKIL